MTNIELLRITHKLSQAQLAQQVSVSQGAVSQWEQGITYPNVNIQKRLAEIFDVSIDYLLGETDGVEKYYADNTDNVSIRSMLSVEESELVRIYRLLNVRQRHKMMSFAFELEDESNK